MLLISRRRRKREGEESWLFFFLPLVGGRPRSKRDFVTVKALFFLVFFFTLSLSLFLSVAALARPPSWLGGKETNCERVTHSQPQVLAASIIIRDYRRAEGGDAEGRNSTRFWQARREGQSSARASLVVVHLEKRLRTSKVRIERLARIGCQSQESPPLPLERFIIRPREEFQPGIRSGEESHEMLICRCVSLSLSPLVCIS